MLTIIEATDLTILIDYDRTHVRFTIGPTHVINDLLIHEPLLTSISQLSESQASVFLFYFLGVCFV